MESFFLRKVHNRVKISIKLNYRCGLGAIDVARPETTENWKTH